MKKDWPQLTAGILLGLGLFLAGCGEKREEGTSQAPLGQGPTAEERSGTGEGTGAAPGYEQPCKEQKPSSQQRQERG